LKSSLLGLITTQVSTAKCGEDEDLATALFGWISVNRGGMPNSWGIVFATIDIGHEFRNEEALFMELDRSVGGTELLADQLGKWWAWGESNSRQTV
jgi:hypothetical protein